MKFIYALNEEDRNELISKGFKFINKQNINNQEMYIFENKSSVSTFAKNEGRFLFSNVMYF